MNRSNVLLKVILVAIILVSCINSTSKTETELAVSENSNTQETNSKKRSIKYFPIKDNQQNMLFAVMPIPTDWKLSDKSKEGVFLESSKGVKTTFVLSMEFMYSNNSYINDSFRQMGFETKPPQPFEQVLEELKGLASKENTKLVNQYELPQLKRNDENLDRLLFKAHPEQKQFRVVATEWEDDKGTKSIAVIHYYVAYSELSMYWGCRVEGMDAPKDYFPTARRDYLNALLNVQINPQWLQQRNQMVRQQAQQQTAGHQQRMAALRSQGDQIIANGKQHDAMTTRTHQKFMDGLNDRVNVTNPSNGQTYKVDLGSSHYWISDNNQLITSDNANYNPNGNLNTNGAWTEAQINN